MKRPEDSSTKGLLKELHEDMTCFKVEANPFEKEKLKRKLVVCFPILLPLNYIVADINTKHHVESYLFSMCTNTLTLLARTI